MKSLGKKAGTCCPEPCDPGEIFYPTIYIDTDEPLSLPDKGEAKIEFVLRRKSIEKDINTGETKCCYTLEVTAIGEATSAPTQKPDRFAEIDELARELSAGDKY